MKGISAEVTTRSPHRTMRGSSDSDRGPFTVPRITGVKRNVHRPLYLTASSTYDTTLPEPWLLDLARGFLPVSRDSFNGGLTSHCRKRFLAWFFLQVPELLASGPQPDLLWVNCRAERLAFTKRRDHGPHHERGGQTSGGFPGHGVTRTKQDPTHIDGDGTAGPRGSPPA